MAPPLIVAPEDVDALRQLGLELGVAYMKVPRCRACSAYDGTFCMNPDTPIRRVQPDFGCVHFEEKPPACGS